MKAAVSLGVAGRSMWFGAVGLASMATVAGLGAGRVFGCSAGAVKVGAAAPGVGVGLCGLAALATVFELCPSE